MSDERQASEQAMRAQMDFHSITEMKRTPQALLDYIASLESALQPFATFAKQLERQPMRGTGKIIYAIPIGTEYEAEIRLDDLRRAASALSSSPLAPTQEGE